MTPAAVEQEFKHKSLSLAITHAPHMHTYSYRMKGKTKFILQNMSGKPVAEIPQAALERAEKLRKERQESIYRSMDVCFGNSEIVEEDDDEAAAKNPELFREETYNSDHVHMTASNEDTVLYSESCAIPVPIISIGIGEDSLGRPNMHASPANRFGRRMASKMALVPLVEENSFNDLDPDAKASPRAHDTTNKPDPRLANADNYVSKLAKPADVPVRNQKNNFFGRQLASVPSGDDVMPFS
jgi:hypothetical protein